MRMIIAGGGTGGHLFPGIAIAEEFLRRDPGNKVTFIGTIRGIEHRVLGKMGYDLCEIDVEGVKGRGGMALLRGVYQVPHSMWQSRRILKMFRPDVVLGVGGYASGPACMTAFLMGTPTAIAEQNAVAGNTNRILGKFVDKIFVTYAQSRNMFPSDKVMVTGNPVRATLQHVDGAARSKRKYRQLLIFGGSQGAAAINKNVLAMLPLLAKMKDNVRILHQTGAADCVMMREAYQQAGLQAEVTPFIDDMAQAYAMTDLIICRAGATSLAEISAVGRAAILIPYPWAANDHQTMNAKALTDAGAAVIISERDLDAAKLFGVIERLLNNDKKLRDMEKNSHQAGRPDAAARIVDACTDLMAKRN